MKRPHHERNATDKILCVDDDPSFLDLYRLELSEEGYQVIVAKDGREALRKFEEESPDLVVMDIYMPVKDGLETLAAMLGKKWQIPIILNTAYSQYRDDFITWGAEAYLLKSPNLTKLKQKIRELLNKRSRSAAP